ncbi:disease resistance protein RPM1 [Eucalyptus grandis]|uniref:disease resistance protein RPM1 n=1 Tax=Eucalyptus grandis TaxID=71139 RepID=UPI00192ECE5E|nr:disease resistance protein RPM1 [Eucalyptus grandis]
MASLAVEATLGLVEIFSSLILKEINQKKDVKDDIDSITSSLTMMRAFLNDEGGTRGNQRHEDKVRQIRDFAFATEDALDEFMFHVSHHIHAHKITKFAHVVAHFFPEKLAFHELSSEIKRIRSRIQNFIEVYQLCAGNTSSGEGGSSNGWSEDHLFHQLIEEDDIVGFEEHVESVCNQLLSREPCLSTISIVGLPGSGKTVLAKQVYECKRVQGHFEFRAWAHVSRSLKLDEVLRSILTQFFPGIGGSILTNEVAMREILNKYVQQQRFLVVLDDIWRMRDWELIINVFQNGSSGSRILFTSRDSNVGASCVEYPKYVHELNGLPWKKASNLFCKKAFRSCNGICPPELEDWSEKIIKKCEGLPLAVIAAGNLLSGSGKFHMNGRNCTTALETIFLLWGLFYYQRQRLIRLWIAEGFVKEARNTSLEEVAENYLNKLVQKNLVHVTARDIDGRVRSCRVLNLVHDFIIAKAVEENFVRSASTGSSLSQERIRRLSAQTENCTNVELSETSGHVRSAFMFGGGKFSNLEFFRLLKVLDMQGAPLEDFPIDIVKLVLLKYLSLRKTNVKTVPKSIKKLALLETLDLKQTSVTWLPGSIFRLHLLRHLLVYKYDVKNYVTFDGAKGIEMHSGRGALSKIQKLSLVKATTELIQKLDAMIHLRKLGLINLKSKDGRKVCGSIQKMEHLSTLDLQADSGDDLELDHIQIKPGFEVLQHLYLKGQLKELPSWVSSLQSLIKVGLKWSRSDFSPLPALQALPNLMELDMADAFTGQTLEFSKNTFSKLKILQIEQFRELSMVVVEVGAMPALEKLTFCKCDKLNMLPLGIENLTCLQELLLYDMNGQLIDRLRKNSEDRNLRTGIGMDVGMSDDGNGSSTPVGMGMSDDGNASTTPVGMDVSAERNTSSITGFPLDTAYMIKMNYSRSAVDNLEKIEGFGGTVLHEVNAHTMNKHPILRRISFDRIVYNFPHAGFYGPEESLLQIELHRDLVRGLKNAKTMLTEDGVIHVTHKTAHPYSKWEIEKLAEEQGLFLVEKVRFSVRDYKGYVNRRGKSPNCYSTFPIGEASTYKFSKNDHAVHRDNALLNLSLADLVEHARAK